MAPLGHKFPSALKWNERSAESMRVLEPIANRAGAGMVFAGHCSTQRLSRGGWPPRSPCASAIPVRWDREGAQISFAC